MPNTFFSLLVVGTLCGILYAQPLDASWTVTVAGQTVQVNPDGSFLVPNIALPDRFGESGQGFSGPNFLSDDWLRLTGFKSTLNGVQYVTSEAFKIQSGVAYEPQQLTFSSTPPPTVAALSAFVSATVLTNQMPTASMVVTATMSNGATVNVSSYASRTTYRSSNTSIARVSAGGQITGLGFGRAFITAINDGVSVVVELDVRIGAPVTTIEGYVWDNTGAPVAGANVRELNAGRFATTNAAGYFAMQNVTSQFTTASVFARATVGGVRKSGRVENIALVPGGVTDVGVVTLTDYLGAAVVSASDNTLQLYDVRNDVVFAESAHVDALDVDIVPDGSMAIVTQFLPSRVAFVGIGGTSAVSLGSVLLPTAAEDVDIACASNGLAFVAQGSVGQGAPPERLHSINFNTQTLVHSVFLAGEPTAVAARGSGDVVLAACYEANLVQVVAVSPSGVMTPGASVNVAGPINVAFAASGNYALVVGELGVSIISLQGFTPQLAQTLTLPRSNAVVVGPDSQVAYVYNRDIGVVYVINRHPLGFWFLAATTSLGVDESGVFYYGVDEMALSRDGATLVVHTESNGIKVINTATGTVVATRALPGDIAGGGVAVTN